MIEIDSLERKEPQVLRSTGAILLGFVTTVVLSAGADQILHATGVYPPWGEPMGDRLYALALCYRLIFAILGCYIAARLAPARPMLHAMILGAIGLVLSILGAAAMWHMGSQWYPIALVLTALPCAWIGGALHSRQAR